MKNLYTTFILVLFGAQLFAQKAYVNGVPIATVDGATYSKTGTFGDTNTFFNWIGVTGDGKTLLTTTFTSDLLFVNTANDSLIDSMPLNTFDMVPVGQDSMFFCGSNVVYVLDVGTKALDSISLATNPFRMERRPGTEEIWISSENLVYVLDYSSGLSSSSFSISNNMFDAGEIRFSPDGNFAYKVSQASMKILKIDATTKTVTDSLQMGTNLFGIEVSSDGLDLFFTSSSVLKLYKARTSDMTITDSVSTEYDCFGLYKNPDHSELWVVMHFDDQVHVYDFTDLSLIDSIPTGKSPHIVAFKNGTSPVGVKSIAESGSFKVYPNPVTDNLQIDLDGNQAYIRLYDLSSKLLLETISNTSQYKLQMESFAPGIYVLDVTTNNKSIREKLIKR